MAKVFQQLPPGTLTGPRGEALDLPLIFEIGDRVRLEQVAGGRIKITNAAGGNVHGWLPLTEARNYLKPEPETPP